MAKIDLLRKLIREEVKAALREELPKIINENLSVPKSGVNNIINEMKKSQFPITLNTVETYKKRPDTQFTKSSHLNAILNETAMSMQPDDIETLSYTSDMVNPTSFFQPKDATVGDINGMLSTARPSSDISMVQINEVPDYSGLMKNLISKGAI
jgi:hypothetical protein